MSHNLNPEGTFNLCALGVISISPAARTDNPEQPSPMIPFTTGQWIISGIIYSFARPLQLLSHTGSDHPTCCTIKRDSVYVSIFAGEMSIL